MSVSRSVICLVVTLVFGSHDVTRLLSFILTTFVRSETDLQSAGRISFRRKHLPMTTSSSMMNTPQRRDSGRKLSTTTPCLRLGASSRVLPRFVTAAMASEEDDDDSKDAASNCLLDGCRSVGCRGGHLRRKPNSMHSRFLCEAEYCHRSAG